MAINEQNSKAKDKIKENKTLNFFKKNMLQLK